MLLSLTSLAHALLASAFAAPAQGQGFGGQQVITLAATDAHSVYATDLDGDGDADVLSSQGNPGSNLAWYENLGAGSFGGQQVITQSVSNPYSVYATDLDGDGDADVLSASYSDDIVAWYENLGSGSFGSQQVITQSADGAWSVYALDLDEDGDADVLSASQNDDTIAWYENLGGGAFGGPQVITQAAGRARCVYAMDLDGDGDADVLSASRLDDKIAWYENLGGGSFGGQQVITQAAFGARSVYATDLDGDGDADVLSASYLDNKIAWYENLGSGSFGGQQVITQAAHGAWSVYATDLDRDGDADVLSASSEDDKIAWYENLGGGSFGSQQVITQSADGALSVYATDLDGDGDADVLSASSDGKIAWYCNNLTVDCNGNGNSDSSEIASGFALDCNNNGILDACEIAGDPALDQDLNGILDACEATGPVFVRYGPTGRLFTAIGPETWLGARAFGVQNALHLATVEDEELGTWLRQVFDLPEYWIGYHDAAVEGQFQWSSLRDVSYENWAPGAPNDFLPDQDFTAVDGSTGLWDTHFANSTFPAIMETMSTDCDGNLLLDDEEISANPLLDLDGDGQLDTCVSPNYCVGGINSTGMSGVMGASGTPFLTDNDLTLEATQLPPGQWSYFVMSASQAYVPGFGGSQGNLCLGAPIVRFNQGGGPGGQIAQTSAAGTRTYALDFANLPQQIVFQPGETWNFQLWFRDQNPGLTSNTTDGISVMFR